MAGAFAFRCIIWRCNGLVAPALESLDCLVIFGRQGSATTSRSRRSPNLNSSCVPWLYWMSAIRRPNVIRRSSYPFGGPIPYSMKNGMRGFTSFVVINLRRDLHPQEFPLARRTNKKGRLPAPIKCPQWASGGDTSLEETEFLFAIADQHALQLLIVIKNDFVCFAADTGFFVTAK
jgi:hypothetical protein